jgi:hypothetical protein
MSGKVPPSSRAGRVPALLRGDVEKAGDLYERFSGHKPESLGKIRLTPLPKVGIVVGECDGILYTTVRDGVTEKYVHRFRTKSKPLFVVAADGTQIVLVGGSYEFTERGIVDK